MGKSHVEACLREVRLLVAAEKYVFVPRPKNQDAWLRLGLTKRSVAKLLVTLTMADYSQGPVPDRDVAGQACWIFGATMEVGPKLQRVEIYVKFVLEKLPGGTNRLKILSIHEAEARLLYPYREAANLLEKKA